MLPPGPRDYWNVLATEHKTIPEHQAWMYDADPFAARKAVDERQAKAAQKATSQSTRVESGGQTSSEFSNAPEAKMAGSLRDLVEDAVKKVSLYHYNALTCSFIYSTGDKYVSGDTRFC